MLRNYLLITLRNMMKNKLFVFINVLGLGLTIALCIIAYLNWQFSDDWDKDQLHSETIYRVQFRHETPGKAESWGFAPMPLAGHLRGSDQRISKVVRFMPMDVNFRIGEELFQTSLGYADSLFFEMFTFEMVDGDVRDFHHG